MTAFLPRLIESCQHHWPSARCGDTEESGSRLREEDLPIARPIAIAVSGPVANRLRRAARKVHSLDPREREKGDGFAVRGPERVSSIFGARDESCLGAIKGTHPQAALAIAGGDKCDVFSIRRKGYFAGVTSENVAGSWGRIELETEDAVVGVRLAEVREKAKSQSRERHYGG